MKDDSDKTTMKQRNELITKMISDKSIFIEVNEGRFAEEVETLFSIAESKENPEDRLMAISALSRITSVVKSLRDEIFDRLLSILNESLPDLQMLESSDDRMYVAKALENAESSEALCRYLFKEAFLEDKGEKARDALLQNAITKSVLAKNFFSIGALVAKDVVTELVLTPDQWLKRFVKIFNIIRKSLVKAGINASDDVGMSLNYFFIAISDIVKAADDVKSRRKFAEESLGLIHALIQLRFSLATESDTYAVMGSVKILLGKKEWHDLIYASEVIFVIRDDLTEAILTLAKQGISDSKLLDYLIQTYPDRKSAEQHVSQIAGRSSAIPVDVKSWLISGGRHAGFSHKDKFSDAGMQGADRSIALLMLDMVQLEKHINTTAKNITESIQMFDPALETLVQTLFTRNRALLNDIKSLAGKRSLRVGGVVGEVVDYSPTDHQLIEGVSVGVRKVKIVSPAIERVINDKVSIVIQAEVERVE